MENPEQSDDLTAATDIIDSVVGLTPEDPLFAVRHARRKVSEATQGSYDLFFETVNRGLALQDRLLVAWYACVLSKAQALGQHYQDRLASVPFDATVGAAIENDHVDQLAPSPLKAMLVFTRKLIVDPVHGDKAALQELKASGIATPDVVTLAQLIAFISYQIRLAAGLQAMKALESQ
jgi:uncharacterized protein YciW